LIEGDVGHSWTLPTALRTVAKSDSGVVLLMNCQNSEEESFEQIQAWGADSPAQTPRGRPSRNDLRTYGIGAQILRDLNVGKARLMSRPRKMPSMAGFALTVTGYHSEPDSQS
jgi:3,4-dihydroxy 2-butanone 4-phosphate synthase/GTP cyclohydrolase II